MFQRTARLPALSLGLALVLGVVLGVVSGCGGEDGYCEAVQQHQAELTDITASGTQGALLQAVPVFQDLARQAPDDIADDWRTFLDPLEALDAALRDAGVDPSAFAGERDLQGVTPDQRAEIRDAASALLDPVVVRAFDEVQQQAKDVCHTPMSL